jgi:hypothetical protein
MSEMKVIENKGVRDPSTCDAIRVDRMSVHEIVEDFGGTMGFGKITAVAVKKMPDCADVLNADLALKYVEDKIWP